MKSLNKILVFSAFSSDIVGPGNMNVQGGMDNNMQTLTAQDQLTKFVEQL